MSDTNWFPCVICGKEAFFAAGGTPGWYHVECKKTAAAKTAELKERNAELSRLLDLRDAQIESQTAELEQLRAGKQDKEKDFREILKAEATLWFKHIKSGVWEPAPGIMDLPEELVRRWAGYYKIPQQMASETGLQFRERIGRAVRKAHDL